MKIINTETFEEIEAVFWNGSQLTEIPEWIGPALNQYEYDKPGWLMRFNQSDGQSVIHIGVEWGTDIAYPGDYIARNSKGSLLAIHADDIKSGIYEII